MKYNINIESALWEVAFRGYDIKESLFIKIIGDLRTGSYSPRYIHSWYNSSLHQNYLCNILRKTKGNSTQTI